jgi:hypothetical protein
MARLDFSNCPPVRPAAAPAGLQASSNNSGALSVPDRPLLGGIELASTDKFDLPSTKLCKRANEATAWYGFGVPISDPADIVLMLRNDISASRRAHAHARRAAHA